MKFENLEIDPAKNPAVLETATWHTQSAWAAISAVTDSYWISAKTAVEQRRQLPQGDGVVSYDGSAAKYLRNTFCLVGLADGQYVFIELGKQSNGVTLGQPIGDRTIEDGSCLSVYPTDAATIDRYVSLVRPDKGPRALGAVPRLGIGSRMTTASWPGVWRAMNRCGFGANPIQNSVREVNLLADVLAARPQRLNYMANFGRVPEGHAGSTFEGLWVAGVLEALKFAPSPSNAVGPSGHFGADADHITVRRGDENTDRAKRVVEAARNYTFFTLDVSDLLDYQAMKLSSEARACDYISDHVGQSRGRKEIIAYHNEMSGLNEAELGRLIAKHWPALDAVERLAEHLGVVKKGDAFDLELSIDETPAGIDTFNCLTSEAELAFLANEIRRRRIPVTHIAPNFGVEKELDYRGSDGLAGLQERIRRLQNVSGEFGIMLDCHSGDDLKPATRRAIGRAARGHIHFKVSPALQIIFAETMNDLVPERFGFWWEDTLDYARREAQAGSGFAAKCLREYETSESRRPSPGHSVFHYYNFASVGRRDEQGRFIHREKFYDLPADFYAEYQRRICNYLCEVAADIELS